jgi:hypothetical protein
MHNDCSFFPKLLIQVLQGYAFDEYQWVIFPTHKTHSTLFGMAKHLLTCMHFQISHEIEFSKVLLIHNPPPAQ